MTRKILLDASESLRAASERADGDVRARLEAESEHMAERAERDDPDVGALRERDRALSDLSEDADDGVSEHIDAAREKLAAVIGDDG